MALYKMSDKNLSAIEITTFAQEEVKERQDLQQALKKNIEVIAPDCLVIFEEFGDWEGSKRRIDLLAIDKNANLVVIELKRDETGAHMELQALRYAAMVASMNFEKTCDYFEQYIQKENMINEDGTKIDAKETILDFISDNEVDLENWGSDVRIILAAADFGKELTSTVLWLIDKGIDITCVRLTPYCYNNDMIIDATQIIPIKEALEYQIQLREKRIEQAQTRAKSRDYSKYKYKGVVYSKSRLALTIMKDWITKHQPKSLEQILETFDKPVRKWIAKDINEIKDIKRFYINDSIVLASGEEIAISSQWGVDNIPQFIDMMRKENFEIEKID